VRELGDEVVEPRIIERLRRGCAAALGDRRAVLEDDLRSG